MAAIGSLLAATSVSISQATQCARLPWHCVSCIDRAFLKERECAGGGSAVSFERERVHVYNYMLVWARVICLSAAFFASREGPESRAKLGPAALRYHFDCTSTLFAHLSKIATAWACVTARWPPAAVKRAVAGSQACLHSRQAHQHATNHSHNLNTMLWPAHRGAIPPQLYRSRRQPRHPTSPTHTPAAAFTLRAVSCCSMP